MNSACIIEINGQAVGVVVADHTRYRFHAADRRVSILEGRVFRAPVDATRAARKCLEGKPPHLANAA